MLWTLPKYMSPRIVNALIIAWLALASARGYARETPKLAIAWFTPMPGISSLNISPDSKFVGLVSKYGKAMCYSLTGERLWSADLPGATDVIIAPGAEYALAYSRLNPCETCVTFLDSTGSRHWSRRVMGAVWSADACKIEDGVRFAVGTGERYVYVFDFGKGRRRYRRWHAPGAVVSINLDPTGERVTYGTWQNSAFGCATFQGERIWETQAPGQTLQHVQALQGGGRALLCLVPNRARKTGEFRLLDSSGKRIWSGELSPSRKDRVLISPCGKYVCVGYTKRISHKGAVEKEEHTVLYDSHGKVLWDKGSLFFAARPLLVTTSGTVLVAGSDKSLFWLGRAGEPEPSLKLPADLVRATSSRDGKRLLIECADGRLYLINIPST